MNCYKDTWSIPPAEFSEGDRSYRYTLWRSQDPIVLTNFDSETQWPKRYVNFICLNPSTATDYEDDPTIRRCIGFGLAWGFKAICVTNIFAFRATDPRVMKAQDDPVGPDNDKWLWKVAEHSSLVVCAWGNHGQYRKRSDEVKRMLSVTGQRPSYLRLGKEPHHPLYLPGCLKPTVWTTI